MMVHYSRIFVLPLLSVVAVCYAEYDESVCGPLDRTLYDTLRMTLTNLYDVLQYLFPSNQVSMCGYLQAFPVVEYTVQFIMLSNARLSLVLRCDWLDALRTGIARALKQFVLLHFSPMSKAQTAEETIELNPEFSFDLSGDPYNDFLNDHLDVQDLVKKGSKPVC